MSAQHVLSFVPAVASKSPSSARSWAAHLGMRFREGFHVDRILDHPEAALEACIDEASRQAFTAFRNLTRRCVLAEGIWDQEWNTPEMLAPFIHLEMAVPGQEVLGAVYVDARNRILDHSKHFIGTMTRASVEPRPILSRAISLNAAGFVLFHTHPTAHPGPSQEDLDFTVRMEKAAGYLGIRLLDHIIVGACGAWTSLRQTGHVS